ncbi:nuclear transport factor 2 family protein [Bacteroidota bacterium]
MKKINLLMIIVVFLAIGACAPKVDMEVEKTNIKTVVDQFTQIWETMDLELFSKTIAHSPDMVNFGTDADERWVGWENLEKAIIQQMAVFEEGTVVIRDQVIKLSDTGKTAWFSEVTDWDLIVQGEAVSMKDCRITGVLEKQNDNWVIVQFHFSLPVIGQAVEY